ncbi:SMP-30/gluconolactonase/LRE family protein [Polaribacter sp. Hel1_85]|uniref:SMP-30/gluconolactonase/LRE family protein n=1 Tax=Polaribacter sp. Hel1_85 TaxID=1250005 RepID=UPI00052C6576|nr:SMP-30/gluconolactonase/LRE family protein [Polaribacter sp. Hel1_85]KGL58715.1 serum paraoxonase/arylesterase 2 [Polaribacter sp. Hel1_85]
MNFKKRILYAVLILLMLYIANIFISTGFFRTIENSFEGHILKEINLPGAEDITISQIDSFAIVSSTARNKFPNTKQEIGGLYFIDLKDKTYKPTLLTKNFNKSFAPHGISIYKKDNMYTIAAINHTKEGEFIEIFQMKNKKLIHLKTLKNDFIYSPNDIVLLDENRFYFTNDHKYKKGIQRLAEDYLGLAIAKVIYFDGKNYTQVADGIAYANGINFDAKRNLLFVASPRKFLIKVYQKNKDNSLTFIEDIDCKTGVDNIEFDTEGNLWIGAHPNLMYFASYAKGDKEISPSEIIKINYKGKGDYTIKQIYMEDGTRMSASTVAATFNNLIFTGNVMDDKFLILEKTSN